MRYKCHYEKKISHHYQQIILIGRQIGWLLYMLMIMLYLVDFLSTARFVLSPLLNKIEIHEILKYPCKYQSSQISHKKIDGLSNAFCYLKWTLFLICSSGANHTIFENVGKDNRGIGDYALPPLKVERLKLELVYNDGNETQCELEFSPGVPLMIDPHQPYLSL